MIRTTLLTAAVFAVLTSWPISLQAVDKNQTRHEQAAREDGNARTRTGGHAASQDPVNDQAKRGTEEGLPEKWLDQPNGARWRFGPRWYFGVNAYNTSTGVYITHVSSGSPARRAGFERGDVIVTVDGYQVGVVNGAVFYLGEELQYRAGPRGDVRFLVRNTRNGQLVNVDAVLVPWRMREITREPDQR